MRSVFFLLLLLLFACSPEKDRIIPILFKRIASCPDQLKQQNHKLCNTLFFTGPELDTARMEIQAPCDCCAGYLCFVNDTLFVHESLCLEEDRYSRGNYVRLGNALILKVFSPSVSHVHEPGFEVVESWEINPHKTNYVELQVSELHGKTVLSLSYEGETDYGLEQEKGGFVSKLKKEGVWRKLGL